MNRHSDDQRSRKSANKILDLILANYRESYEYWELAKAMRTPASVNVQVTHEFQVGFFTPLAVVLNGYSLICLLRCFGRNDNSATLENLAKKLGTAHSINEVELKKFSTVRDKWLAHSDVGRLHSQLRRSIKEFDELLKSVHTEIARFAKLLDRSIPVEKLPPEAKTFDQLLTAIHDAAQFNQVKDRSRAGCQPAKDIHLLKSWRPDHD